MRLGKICNLRQTMPSFVSLPRDVLYFLFAVSGLYLVDALDDLFGPNRILILANGIILVWMFIIIGRLGKFLIKAVAERKKKQQQNPFSPKPIVLGPHFNKDHHGFYVDKLEQLIMLPEVRNIALTGGYGTGKSSVIQGLIKKIRSSKELGKNQPIIISLPTIQIINESGPGSKHTDRIQREIVKQLLYRSNPRKMRGSYYHRVAYITTLQRVTICFIFAMLLTFTFWLLAKPEWHWHWSQGGSLHNYWQPIMVQFLLWALTFYVDWIWVDKPAIKGLQLGPTKLELDKNDSSYFDKYLNEIIYYFEVSGTNLVIFEDLDRFDDPYIFDALHELNELINISLGQERFIEQKSIPVRFIYTTRESIFEYKTKGSVKNAATRHSHQLEIENRTKFFDTVIPIIPFSTPRNAYEYIARLLNHSMPSVGRKVDRELQEIVGSEVSDYRLLANIISEFQIFTNQIFNSWNTDPATFSFLEEHANYLFAFVAYKNTHFTDYERMQTGNSDIDKMNMHLSTTMKDVHEIVTNILYNFKKSLVHHINKTPDLHNLRLYFSKLSIYDISQLLTKTIKYDVSTGRFPTAQLVNLDSNYEIIGTVGTIDSSILAKILTDTLIESGVSESSLENLELIVEDISSIINYPDSYSHLINGISIPLNEIQEKVAMSRKLINEMFSYDKMTQNLILSNYINENFHIYTSVFTEGYSVGSIKVLNFFKKNIRACHPNVGLSLNEKDAKEITRKLTETQGKYPNLAGALNADLMLYLVRKHRFHIVNTILIDAEKYKSKHIIETLVDTLLLRINNRSDLNYIPTTRLLYEIASKYEDILIDNFEGHSKGYRTEEQKILLISSVLARRVNTNMKIKEYIKDNIEKITSIMKQKFEMEDEEIKKEIDKSLGLNPVITAENKEIMKRMLTNDQLKGITEQEINDLEQLDKAPNTTEFFHSGLEEWIPLQNLTEYELKRLEDYSLLGKHGLNGS